MRPPVPGDAPRLAALHAESRIALSGSRGGRELLAELETELPPPEALVDWAGVEGHHLVVGTYEGSAVGYALARSATLGALGPRIARVLWLYVEPAAREVGVGRCLLEAVTSWALAVGATGLDVSVLPGDRSTKALLEAGGHRARQVVMHRDLATSPPTGPVAVAR